MSCSFAVEEHGEVPTVECLSWQSRDDTGQVVTVASRWLRSGTRGHGPVEPHFF